MTKSLPTSISRLMMAILLVASSSRIGRAQTTTSAPAAAATTTSSPAASPTSDSDSDSGWGGCVNLKDKGSAAVKIGSQTIVCLQVGNTANWAAGVSYIRLSFTPEADQYSRFYVPDSYANLVSNNTNTIWQGKNITVGAASLQALSFLKMYYNIQSKKIYPFLTAIINVNKGAITSITWDDACVFCSPGQCEQVTYDFNGNLQSPETSGQPTGGCYIPQGECKAGSVSGGGSNNPDANVCDLMLYVVWSGTDASNRAFQSANSRFSAFPPQNIQDRLAQLLPENPFGSRRDLLLAAEEASVLADGRAAVEFVPGGGGAAAATVPEF